jgi:hypothetical protein
MAPAETFPFGETRLSGAAKQNPRRETRSAGTHRIIRAADLNQQLKSKNF